MKRQRSQSSISSRRKKPRIQRQDATVSAVVRKELRKKTDWKYTDNTAYVNSTTSGTITSCLANLVRGDLGLDNFNGNEIRPQALLVQYLMHTNQTWNTVRVLIIQWFDANPPTLGGILQNVTVPALTVSPTFITNKRYMKVLYDKTHMLAPSAGGDTTPIGLGVIDPVKIYIPGKRLRSVKYNATTGNCQDGNIYIVHMSDDAFTSFPQILWYSRVTFSDS